MKKRWKRSLSASSSRFGILSGEESLFWKKDERARCNQYRFDLLQRDNDRFEDRKLMKWQIS